MRHAITSIAGERLGKRRADECGDAARARVGGASGRVEGGAVAGGARWQDLQAGLWA